MIIDDHEFYERDLSYAINGCAMKVHTALGPGLLEKTYEECLAYELRKAGYKVEQQVGLPVIYDEIKLDIGYRADLLVEDKIIVELKSVEKFHPVFYKAVKTYLKLSNLRLALLINFNVISLKDGIERVYAGIR